MRLLLVGPIPPPLGGATVLFQQLVKEITAIPGVTVLMINTSREGKTSVFLHALRAIQVFIQMVIKAPKVDIISFHASIHGMASFGPAVWLISKVFGKPIIFRGFGGYHADWHRNATPLVKFIFNRTILQADAVLLETRASIDYFRSISNSKVMWFPNARPSAVFDPGSHACQREAKRFVFVGHVISGKGIHQIIDAGEKITEDIIIDVYGPLLDDITCDVFVGKRTRYRGVIEPDQVIQTISQYDVLLLPTFLKTEGYPGVILEAYSAGVPVIASRIGAIEEIVDSSSGILIEPRSAEQLIGAMRMLLSSSQRMQELRVGAAIMAHKFSAGVWAAKFLETCRRLSMGTAIP